MQGLHDFTPGKYDLLLLDVRMPEMSGFEPYREIRKIDGKINVCFLTAFETFSNDFIDLFPTLDNVKCYLKKPITMEDLIKKLLALLEPS